MNEQIKILHMRMAAYEDQLKGLNARTLGLQAQLFRMLNPESEENLCDQLDWFCMHNKLPRMSADELLLLPTITGKQATWLNRFIQRWDAL